MKSSRLLIRKNVKGDICQEIRAFSAFGAIMKEGALKSPLSDVNYLVRSATIISAGFYLLKKFVITQSYEEGKGF
jgi:hypothetical protein